VSLEAPPIPVIVRVSGGGGDVKEDVAGRKESQKCVGEKDHEGIVRKNQARRATGRSGKTQRPKESKNCYLST